MFRLFDTLPRFFHSSSYRVNLSTNGCCSRRIIANSFYSAGGCTINSASRSPITQPKLRNNKSTWSPPYDRSSTSVDIASMRGRNAARVTRFQNPQVLPLDSGGKLAAADIHTRSKAYPPSTWSIFVRFHPRGILVRGHNFGQASRNIVNFQHFCRAGVIPTIILSKCILLFRFFSPKTLQRYKYQSSFHFRFPIPKDEFTHEFPSCITTYRKIVEYLSLYLNREQRL